MSVHGLRNRVYKGVGVLVLGAAFVAATGCGDSGSSGGSAAQGGGGPGVAEALALAEKATTRPTSIGLTTAIGKSVPTGKKVAFISCGVEVWFVTQRLIVNSKNSHTPVLVFPSR